MLSSELLDSTEAAIEQAWPSLTRDITSDEEDPSAKQLLDDLSKRQQQTYAALLSLEEALRDKRDGAEGAANSDGSGADSTLVFQLLKERARRLDRSIDLALAFANDYIARQQFVNFRRTCVRAGAAVALGAVLIAWALNPPPTAVATAATAQGPRPVNVYLSQSARDELKASLGDSCVKLPYIRAVAIGGSLEEPLVVIDSSTGCTARRLTITHERGVALPIVSIPTTTTTRPGP